MAYKDKNYERTYRKKRKVEFQRRVYALAESLGKDPKHCLACGKTSTGKASLHWHHRKPTEKLFVIATPGSYAYSDQKLLEELAKCDRLCKSCHRYRHSVAGQGSVRPTCSTSATWQLNMAFRTKENAELAKTILLALKMDWGEV